MDDEKTMMVVEPEAERTQMVGSVECPVCHEANPPAAEWCAECGFRLGTEAGEVAEAPVSWALVGAGGRYPLKEGENVVGRLNADVFLSDPSVSRRHAVVTVHGTEVSVRDESSSNGTKVAGLRIPPATETPAVPGDAIQFGSVPMTLEAPEGVELPEVPPERAAPRGDVSVPAVAMAAPEPPAVAILTDGVDTWPLHEGPNTIGRRADNDVALADPAVSGRHAVLTIRDGRANLADVGSTNGTYLGGQRMVPGAESELAPGVEIRFGRVVLNYEAVPKDSPLAVPEGAAAVSPEVPEPWAPVQPSGEAPAPLAPPAADLGDTASGIAEAPAPDEEGVWADAGQDGLPGA